MPVWTAVRRTICAAAAAFAANGAMAQDDGVRLLGATLAVPGGERLAANALVVVEAVDAQGRSVGETSFRARGAFAEIAVSLGVPEDVDLALRAAVFPGARPEWVLPEIAVAAGADDLALGTLDLAPHRPLFTTSAFRCGEARVTVGAFTEAAILETGGLREVLPRVPSGSGARYSDEDATETAFWDRGREALLTLDGEEYPECAPVPPVPAPPYVVRGNEPGWSATISDGEAEIVTDYGASRAVEAVAGVDFAEGALAVSLAGGGTLRLVLGPCNDTMTGMPYPERAELALGDGVLTGCGGSPADLLVGPAWKIASILGAEIGAEAPATFEFSPSGGVSGFTGCNRYVTALEIGGEALTPGPIAATKRACPDWVMAQESDLFRALSQIARFDIGEGGTVLFYGNETTEPVLTLDR